MPVKAKRKQRFRVFRLFEDDRALLQNIGRGRPEVEDRYEALCELARLVPELDLEDVRKKKRRALRIAIPDELTKALRAVSKATGQTAQSILLAAAREYRKRYPFNPPK